MVISHVAGLKYVMPPCGADTYQVLKFSLLVSVRTETHNTTQNTKVIDALGYK